MLTEYKWVEKLPKEGNKVTEMPSVSTKVGISILGDAQKPTKALSNFI